MILTFEEFCGEDGEFAGDNGKSFASIFAQVQSLVHSHCLISLCVWCQTHARRVGSVTNCLRGHTYHQRPFCLVLVYAEITDANSESLVYPGRARVVLSPRRFS